MNEFGMKPKGKKPSCYLGLRMGICGSGTEGTEDGPWCDGTGGAD